MPKYGGKGKFELPASHIAGFRVPKGGSSCAGCRFVGSDGKTCNNTFWVQWNGENEKLPEKADEYCCDWFEAPGKTALSKRMMVK